MQTALLVAAVLTTAVLAAGIFYLILGVQANRRESAAHGSAIAMLAQQMETVRNRAEQLSESVDKNLQAGQQTITSFLTQSSQTLGQLREQLGRLKGDSEQMVRIGQDIRVLHDILKSPKLRGLFGEQSLGNLLMNILPAEHFVLQHCFRCGRVVDALIRLPDFSVPIDAKFPLPSFERMIAATDEEERGRLRRQFHIDVCKHIDKIADSYILPSEGTLDFALMYIPAENVYYETIIRCDGDRADLPAYAAGRKVIPVSPNLLYAYLMTIVMGLHGLRIEKQAARIRADLQQLTGGLSSFLTHWEILGRHLRNAQGQYEEGQIKLNKFTLQLEHIRRPEALEEAGETSDCP
jgi:DNA recombination protein RmuC